MMIPTKAFRRKLILLVLSALFSLPALQSQAQDRCGTMAYHDQLLHTDPTYKAHREQVELMTTRYYAMKKSGLIKEGNETITIPVVVHIVWNTPDQNIPDERVYEQIDRLNEDYNFRNADKSQIPAPFMPYAGDFNIEFCLAPWQDDRGNWQAPITRTQTNVLSFKSGTNQMKRASTGGHDNVNPAEYLNLWVCNLSRDVLGFATLPGSAPADDGVVINTYAFGNSSGGPTGRFNMGRTTTHEVGHWLNLYHLWGDQKCGDDLVADTPQQRWLNVGIPAFPHKPNDCSPDNPEGNMFMNYMDYCDDKALVMFTKGQIARSMALFANNGIRETLRSSGFLCGNSPGLNKGCSCTAPEFPRFLDVGSKSVHIVWNEDKVMPKEYEIRYRKSAGGQWYTLPIQESSEVTISGLEESQLYMFQVRSKCKTTHGTSDWRSLVAGTSQGRYQCPKLSSRIAAITATEATINWNTSPYYQKVEISYAPYFKGKPTGIVRTELDPAVTSKTISDLKPNTKYYVLIQAYCVGGQIEVKKDFTTGGCGKPYDLEYDVIDRNTVEFTWKTPNKPSEVIDYIFTYREEGNEDSRIEIHNVTPPYTVKNLPPNTHYEWLVRANCTFGQQKWSAFNKFSTTNCEKPVNFEATNLTEASVKLIWDPPPAGDVHSYILRYRVEGTTTWTTNIVLQPFFTLTGLSSGFPYEVEVESICDLGGVSDQLRHRIVTQGCSNPSAKITDIMHNGAVISFLEKFPPGADVEFRVLENGNTIYTERAGGIPKNGRWLFEGMSPGNTYTAQYRIICANGEQAEWVSFLIQTQQCPVPIAYNHKFTSASSESSVEVSWELSHSGKPDSYELTLKDDAGNTIHDRLIVAGSNTGLYLNSLTPATNYTLFVNSICGGIVEEGPEYQFSTVRAVSGRTMATTTTGNKLNVKLSPNPVQDKLTIVIRFEGKPSQKERRGITSFSIYDMHGRELIQEQFITPQAVYNLNIGHLQNGLYLLEINQNGLTTVNKVVIDHR